MEEEREYTPPRPAIWSSREPRRAPRSESWRSEKELQTEPTLAEGANTSLDERWRIRLCEPRRSEEERRAPGDMGEFGNGGPAREARLPRLGKGTRLAPMATPVTLSEERLFATRASIGEALHGDDGSASDRPHASSSGWLGGVRE